MIKVIYGEGFPARFEASTFPGGEQHFRFKYFVQHRTWDIHTALTSSDAIMQLAMAVDAIRQLNPHADIKLTAPYLPYARQDRVCNDGEALALKVMCQMLNAMRFSEVEIWDVHSPVSLALLDRVRNIQASRFVDRIVYEDPLKYVLVAPDAGAVSRVRECAKHRGMAVVRADKIRDPKTGEITDTVVYSDHIVHHNFLIVDDICDGGATFIALAKKLRPLTDGAVLLYVTHGIFSKGLEVFHGLIDQIYCPNIWPGVSMSGNASGILSPIGDD